MNRPTDDNENRIRSIVDSVIGTESADDLMIDLMNALTEGSKIPQVGRYYTFIYNPKTHQKHPTYLMIQIPLLQSLKYLNGDSKVLTFTGVK